MLFSLLQPASDILLFTFLLLDWPDLAAWSHLIARQSGNARVQMEDLVNILSVSLRFCQDFEK